MLPSSLPPSFTSPSSSSTFSAPSTPPPTRNSNMWLKWISWCERNGLQVRSGGTRGGKESVSFYHYHFPLLSFSELPFIFLLSQCFPSLPSPSFSFSSFPAFRLSLPFLPLYLISIALSLFLFLSVSHFFLSPLSSQREILSSLGSPPFFPRQHVCSASLPPKVY